MVFFVDSAEPVTPATGTNFFETSKFYGLVVISGLTLMVQCFLYGMFIVGHYRKRVFNKNFMQAEFGQLHQDVTGQAIAAGGYPDMGNGVYSQRLDYNSWLLFNKAQRIHQNFLETLPISVIFLLVAGIQFPITSAVFGFIQVFARLLSISYISNKGTGHFLRVLSSVLVFASILTTFVLAFIKSVNYIKSN